MPEGTVVLGCAADGGYALPLAVMLRSAVDRVDPSHLLEVYAVDAGVPPDDRVRVERSLGGRARIRWVAPRRDAFVGLPLWGRMSIATYDKLAIARWLPDDVGRVLWLDADLLVLADLAELWRMPLGDAIVAATQDTRVPTMGARFGVGAHATLGLAAGDKYFNAGVMLIDLHAWRAADVERRALGYLRANGRRVYFWDQEALNVALAGRWTELEPQWNWTPLAGADVGATAPRILHFSGNLKPWRHPGRSDTDRVYQRAIDATAWAGYRPPASWWAEGVNLYQASGLRRFALPLEHGALALLRAATLRYATASDLATGRTSGG